MIVFSAIGLTFSKQTIKDILQCSFQTAMEMCSPFKLLQNLRPSWTGFLKTLCTGKPFPASKDICTMISLSFGKFLKILLASCYCRSLCRAPQRLCDILYDYCLTFALTLNQQASLHHKCLTPNLSIFCRTKSIPGASVEHNKFCVSVHFRNCEPDRLEEVIGAVEAVLAHDKELKATRGRKVLEVRPQVLRFFSARLLADVNSQVKSQMHNLALQFAGRL